MQLLELSSPGFRPRGTFYVLKQMKHPWWVNVPYSFQGGLSSNIYADIPEDNHLISMSSKTCCTEVASIKNNNNKK